MQEEFLQSLYIKLQERVNDNTEESYTKFLLDSGLEKIVKKLGEETIEVIAASYEMEKEPPSSQTSSETKEHLISECADLIYHLLVLILRFNITPEDIFSELQQRNINKSKPK